VKVYHNILLSGSFGTVDTLLYALFALQKYTWQNEINGTDEKWIYQGVYGISCYNHQR
jgi:hypothetical protein